MRASSKVLSCSLVLFFAACSSGVDPSGSTGASSSESTATSTSGGNACIPGQQLECACLGGTHGVQACKESGTGFEPCNCGGTSSSAGTGGAGGGGQGTGGAMACVPGTTLSCYDGPAGTLGIGICKVGSKTCNAQGDGYGPCTGQVTPAPVELCATAVDDDCNGSNMPCTNDPLWAHSAGNVIAPHAVAVDQMGNTVFVGGFGGDIDWGFGKISAPNGPSVLVTRFDTSGTQLWSKVWGGAQSRGFSVAIDGASNILVGGRIHDVVDFGGGPLGVAGVYSCFIVKLSSAGVHLWSRASICGGGSPLGGNPGVQTIATDATNNVFIGGTEVGIVDFGFGPLPHAQNSADIWIIKLDASGNPLWSKDFGADFDSNCAISSMVTTPGGDLVAVGVNSPNVDFGGGKLTGRVYVLELKANGTYGWAKTITMQNSTQPQRLAVDSAGNVLVAGDFTGSVDLGFGSQIAQYGGYLSKRDGTGKPLWGKVYPGSNIIWKVAAAPTGIFFAGTFGGSIDFGAGPLMTPGPNDSDAFLTRLDSAGTVVSTKIISGMGTQGFLDFALTPANNIVATGEYVGTIDFGGGAGPITSVVAPDNFIAKFVP